MNDKCLRFGIGAGLVVLAASLFLQVTAIAGPVPVTKRSVVAVSVKGVDGKREASVECIVAAGVEVGVSALAFSTDGRMLAAGGYKEVVVWDLGEAKFAKRIGVGKLSGSVHSLAFLKGSGELAVGEGSPGVSGAVRIFDIETGKQTALLEQPKDVVYALAVSPDGKLLAAGSADSDVYIWSTADKKLAGTITEHTGRVLSAAFSADGKSLATGSADKTAKVWEVGTWESIARLKQQEAVRGVAFGTDGKTVACAVGGATYNAVRLMRADTSRQTRAIYTNAGAPLDIVWTAKPYVIYTACAEKSVKAFDGWNGRLLRTFAGHRDWVYAVAVSPDGKKLATGCADGSVKLYNTATAKEIGTLYHISTGADDWLIGTPAGYVAASNTAAMRWKGANIQSTPEQLAERFVNSDKVRQAFGVAKPKPKPAVKKPVAAATKPKPKPAEPKPVQKKLVAAKPKPPVKAQVKPAAKPKAPVKAEVKKKPAVKKESDAAAKDAVEPKKDVKAVDKTDGKDS